MKNIYINKEDFETNIAVAEDGKLLNFFSERNIYAKSGNIYKGKIEKVVNNMNFAFVNIGDEKPGFLSEKAYSELIENGIIKDKAGINSDKDKISKIFQKGQDVLVQVIRTSYKTKGSRLTTNIAIPGYYTVLSPYSDQTGVSKKIIDEKERRRLRDVLMNMKKKIKGGVGLIARTTSEGVSERQIEEEIKQNFNKWQNILKMSKKAKSPALLYEEEKFHLKILRDILNNSVKEIMADSEDVLKDVDKYLKNTKMNGVKVRLHKAPENIFEYYKLINQIKSLKNRIVPFKQGGYLKIDATEALTVIDVNSGKFKGENDVESSILMLNLNAAREVARQIILRNIGGLIVVDFVDMQTDENKNILRKEIEKELSKSKVYFKTIEINEFGLLVISRKRTINRTEEVYFDQCPVCDGKGIVPTKESICIEQLKKIKYVCKTEKKSEVVFDLKPEIKQELQSKFINNLKKYEKDFKKKIILR